MGLRFHKSVKILPGVRLNFSKSGISTSIGGKGHSINIGQNGVYGSLGIPGTGLSYRQKIGDFNKINTKQDTYVPQPANMILDQNNKVLFVDEYNNPYNETLQKKMRSIYKDQVIYFYRQKAEEINKKVDELQNLHKNVFPLKEDIYFEREVPFEIAFPNIPYDENYMIYKNNYENSERRRIELIRQINDYNLEIIEEILEIELAKLEFPLETNISFKVLNKETIFLDVDLPEIEDLPMEKASITEAGNLSIKKRTQKDLKENYLNLVLGIAYYVISYVFSVIPTCMRVIMSAYTQRMDLTTGHIKDTYIYSLDVNGQKFFSLNFQNIDPKLAINNFNPIIKYTSTFELKEIEPYEI